MHRITDAFAASMERALGADRGRNDLRAARKWCSMLLKDRRELLADNAKLALKARLVDHLPFCPDHRDKVAGKPCRECEIERLTAIVERIAFMGTDKPAVTGSSDAEWYQRIARECISIAARGLQGETAEPAGGGE